MNIILLAIPIVRVIGNRLKLAVTFYFDYPKWRLDSKIVIFRVFEIRIGLFEFWFDFAICGSAKKNKSETI
ncbi:hypothetical protein DPV73_16430 [Leptospira mayottensis]|nr:hypothetical protein DPV73_16430 [Leptospira mayottensis]